MSSRPDLPHHLERHRLLDSREAAGFCGLKVIQFREQAILNLLYRFDPAVWGQGLATEAATAVVAWAGQHQPQRPVIARVRPANTASARVAIHAGLTRAEDLDGPGYDGHDLVFVSKWSKHTDPNESQPVLDLR